MKRLVILCLLVAASSAAAPPPLDAKTRQLAFDICDIQVLGPNPREGNLVARLHGTGKDNAIYQLANGLVRLENYQFPVTLNEVTRAWFERMSFLYVLAKRLSS